MAIQDDDATVRIVRPKPLLRDRRLTYGLAGLALLGVLLMLAVGWVALRQRMATPSARLTTPTSPAATAGPAGAPLTRSAPTVGAQADIARRGVAPTTGASTTGASTTGASTTGTSTTGTATGTAAAGTAPALTTDQAHTGTAEYAAGLEITLADEAEILAARALDLLVFRVRALPAVLALSFPTLHQQGQMLDRMGAFVEKGGLPHDRVLIDAELDAAIRQAGDTPETYYYGHDYRAADMARFFAAVDHDAIPLNPEEKRLHLLLQQLGMLSPGAVGALISIPPESQTPPVDATSRATILHHELSHGAYFTDPAYAAYARRFWETALTETQRAGFRSFLGNEGYDTANEDLMLNEAQAYLVHTADPRFFRPELAGLSAMEAAQLRQAFMRDMPDGWLNSSLATRTP